MSTTSAEGMHNTGTSATPTKCCNCGNQLKVSLIVDQHGNKFCGPCFRWIHGAGAPVKVPSKPNYWLEPGYDPRPKIFCW